MNKPFIKPKGWRAVVVNNVTWYWTTSGGYVVARNSNTREKIVCNDMAPFESQLGKGAWDDFHECHIIEPRHVSAWINSITS